MFYFAVSQTDKQNNHKELTGLRINDYIVVEGELKLDVTYHVQQQ